MLFLAVEVRAPLVLMEVVAAASEFVIFQDLKVATQKNDRTVQTRRP